MPFVTLLGAVSLLFMLKQQPIGMRYLVDKVFILMLSQLYSSH